MAGPEGEASLEDIFREFKKGVEQQLSAEDYETHFNLGIAYKEMGLVDEAIGEFQLASKDPARAVECCSMLGLCFLEKGMPQLAIKWYRKGLEAGTIQLQTDLKDIEAAGVQLVGISYDSVDILAKFSKTSKITYPLLSDAGSKTIGDYNLLNKEAKGTQGALGRRHRFASTRREAERRARAPRDQSSR